MTGVTQGMMMNVYDTLLKFNGSSMNEFLPSLSTQVPTVENGLISPGRADLYFSHTQGR